MREEAFATIPTHPETTAWRGGLLAGLAGGLVMGVVMSAMNPAVLSMAVPSLYGLAPPPNPVAGWVAHLAHAAVFGLFYAGVAHLAAVETSVVESTALGLAYGMVAWLLAAGIAMPLWLGAVGSPVAAGLPWPNLDPTSLLWHVVFGAVVGATFPRLREL
ncbi:histidine kinase [Halomarina litorea]|uniref:histidine kinase n=1 Tax=Halomarina litorea TaxID=2961595 RepID=UPI0020C25141|nr:histidine kinase [Halomarina sp. BCD28]